MADALKYNVNEAVIDELAGRFLVAAQDFDSRGFREATVPLLNDLELKPRIELIARSLRASLPGGYPAALEMIVDVAQVEPLIEGWSAWPLASVIELFGGDDPEISLRAMEVVTKRITCEFAIRPFLRDHFDLAFAQLEQFTHNDDAHVRRLPSEGMRPKLPWAPKVQRLVDDPMPGLQLLEKLRHDPSEMVRRSVANHLNDVAKDSPELVVETATRWLGEPETDKRMISHALRTLVKQGDVGALEALGFTTRPEVAVNSFVVSPDRVGMGEHITLSAEVCSTGAVTQRIVVDFVVHHVGVSGKTSPKVFKWTVIDLEPGESVQLSKRRLIQQASTRTYRSGSHRVELLLSGSTVAEGSFEVDLISR